MRRLHPLPGRLPHQGPEAIRRHTREVPHLRRREPREDQHPGGRPRAGGEAHSQAHGEQLHRVQHLHAGLSLRQVSLALWRRLEFIITSLIF